MAYTVTPAYGVYSGNTITLDNIQRETLKKSANLVVLPLPLSDSQKTDVFDYMGVTKEINLEGMFVGNNTGSVTGWIGSMMGLVQGEQTGSSLFVGTHIGSIVIKVADFTYDWAAGDPNKVVWTLKLVESTAHS